jgi:hypothetical protein
MDTRTCDGPSKRTALMVPTFTPENQTLLPFLSPATSLKYRTEVNVFYKGFLLAAKGEMPQDKQY